MDQAEARTVVISSLNRVAPDADPEAVDGSRPLQDELDLDSVDFLHLMVAIHEQTGIQIPERAYPLVAHLDGLVAYLVNETEPR